MTPRQIKPKCPARRPGPPGPTGAAVPAARSLAAGRDEGAITLFVVVIAAALLAMAGLVIDGGYVLAARQQARSVAEQAARAGADQIARESIRTGGVPRLDPAAATAAAHRYLEVRGQVGQVAVQGEAVTVTVRIARPAAILSAVGIDTLSATATATAHGLTGIDHPEPWDAVGGRETP